MKNNKKLIFTFCGLAGGVVGSLAAELPPEFGHNSRITMALHTALWFALIAAFITMGLFASGEIYNRRPFSAALYRKGLVSGLLAGALAGFVAQSVFSTYGDLNVLVKLIFQSFCWGIMGAILGWRLSAVIPNLGATRGIISGLLGGFIGGLGFLISGMFFMVIDF